MKFKRKHILLLIVVLLVGTFFLGPRPDYPDIDPLVQASSLPIDEVENAILAAESKVEDLKPGNASFIRWGGVPNRQTEYSVLFLHGFSASPVAGTPVATDFAQRYGYNYYAPRLSGHGLASIESFADLSPADYVHSAKEALAIARVLGRKTIVMASSTGCTAAAYLAAHNPDYVQSMLFYSPNIDLADPMSNLLTWPWGLQLARLFVGKYRTVESLVGTPSEPYWTTKYRTEGLLAVKYLIRETMQEEHFKKINQPLYLGYYFQDEEHKDKTVSIPAMKDFFAEINTPDAQKRMEPIGKAGAHVMLSDIQCKDVDAVREKTYAFAEEVLGLQPAPDSSDFRIDTIEFVPPPVQ